MMSVNRFLIPHARHYSKSFTYKNSLNPTLFWDVNYHIFPFNRRGDWGISPEMNFYRSIPTTKDFPCGSDSRVCLQCRRPGFNPWAREIPWRRKWQSTPIFLPGKSHGWRSWWATGHRVTKSQTGLSDITFTFFLMLGKIEGRRRGHRGWDSWMASLTWWMWVWANSGR